MFQQLRALKFLSLQKLGVKLCVGAFVTISEASVIQRGRVAAGPGDPLWSLPAPEPVVL